MDRRSSLLAAAAKAGILRLVSQRPNRHETGLRRRGGLGLTAVLLPIALAACSPASESGTITADEARQLNDAAAMLDANSVDLNAVAAAPDTGETPSNQSSQTR